MYVDYETYQQIGLADVKESAYPRMAMLADAMIDHVTLDRVGNAVKNGEDLPDCVKVAYCAIIDEMPRVVADRKGERVSSFSNGVDSFSFDLTVSETDRIINSVVWMLPVEWISAVVSFEGGNRYAR